ncbi:hypothetical protein CANARDRAFT_28029 [[Candida] arabinofermentans NRRL YB-2248]|uniref:BHLH domain-containing protein n=1 Tax=[Candida] arabinofermentans NRRL YB-2248 TaxID=983967 RepID=A0A1E4T2H8_9ASCO|nr:hypothetical protein CANARDRAFT_28029 [[Candida] arabinofermentans NRRL YB-2248]
MDNFDFLADKEAPIPVLNGFQGQQSQPQQKQLNGAGNGVGSNNDFQFDVNQLDQFVENLSNPNSSNNFVNFNNGKYPQSNIQNQNNAINNPDGSPFSFDFDYGKMNTNNTSITSVGNNNNNNNQLTPTFNIDSVDDFGTNINGSNINMNNNANFNLDDFQDTRVMSPQAIPSTTAAERSLSIGGMNSINFNSAYASPQVKASISTSISNQRSGSISNQGGRSYSSQLGTSLNNLISPTSTYDGYLDSPYGSNQSGSFNDSYLRSPINSPSFKSIGSPASVGSHLNPKNSYAKESKLNRRRELHNAVERRRRDLIKEKIKELGTLIPPTLLYDLTKLKNSNAAKDVKANKSTILTRCVEYIAHLQDISDSQDSRLAELEAKIQELSSPNSIIKSESSKIQNVDEFQLNQMANVRQNDISQYNNVSSAQNSNSPFEFGFDSPNDVQQRQITNPPLDLRQQQQQQQQPSQIKLEDLNFDQTGSDIKLEDPTAFFSELLQGSDSVNPGGGNPGGGGGEFWNL